MSRRPKQTFLQRKYKCPVSSVYLEVVLKTGLSIKMANKQMKRCSTLLIIIVFPGGSAVKVSACNAGDLGLIPGWGRSPGEANGNPLQDLSFVDFFMMAILTGVR